MFAKQSMINQLSNPINRNCSAAKNSKVMSSSIGLDWIGFTSGYRVATCNKYMNMWGLRK